MKGAEAVANSLGAAELAAESVVPNPNRIRDVAVNVATATALEAQRLGLAGNVLGATEAEVRAAVVSRMWSPGVPPPSNL